MEIVEATGATPASLPDPSLVLSGISTDTRSLGRGELFIALKGEHYDGHHFVNVAVLKGAGAILVQRPDPVVQEVPQLFVPDTLHAYGKLAAAYRKKLKTRFIAITGSMGKTTVKEMAHAILSKRYRCAKTEKNENNRIGVPKTILRIPPDAETAIIEMGSNMPGEIALLTEIVQPDRAMITNTAPVHLEHFISPEGVRIEKGALFWRSPEHAIRFINQDDENIRKIPLKSEWIIQSFGREEESDVRGTQIVSLGLNGTRFTLSTPGSQIEINLPLLGVHHVNDAIAAASIGIIEGISLQEIKSALESFKGTKHRLEPIIVSPNIIILNDTYNASPVATIMAIRTLSVFHPTHTLIAILGDMLELGKAANHYHRKIGAECARAGIHVIGLIGTYAETIRTGAIENGFDESQIFYFENARQLLMHLTPYLDRPAVILVKGSNALHMEQWVKILLSALSEKGGNA